MKSFSLMWLLIACCCSLCASVYADATEVSDVEAEQFYQSITPPETVTEILKLFRAVATSGVYSRNDFYTTETMKRLFGEQRLPEVLDDGIVTLVTVHGWEPLVTGPNAHTVSLPYMKGVWIEGRKPDANTGRNWSRLDISFWGQFDGLDFESVTQLLGPGWTRDLPSGDITYLAGKSLLVLEFDTAGRLHSIMADWDQRVTCPTNPIGRRSNPLRRHCD